MKSIVLCLVAITLLIAGCSKKTVSDRDKFVGHYSMNDTMILSAQPTPSGYDTIYTAYTLIVSAMDGSINQLIFTNAHGNAMNQATVSGNIAVNDNVANSTFNTATLTGNKLVFQGGDAYSAMGSIIYAAGSGTKQ